MLTPYLRFRLTEGQKSNMREPMTVVELEEQLLSSQAAQNKALPRLRASSV